MALPLEELRRRFEVYVRSRVPRAYRFDWRDLRARVSYHRDAEPDLMRVIGELGGVVVEVKPLRPPMKVVDVDFSKAKPPPAIFPPELEKAILWSKFTAILSAAGVSPEEYADVFEALYSRLVEEGKPFEEKQRRVEEEARSIIAPKIVPPPPPVPKELMDRLEALERELRELRDAVAWRPKSTEEIRMVFEATMLVEPEVVRRVDKAGHVYWGPSDACMAVLKRTLDAWAVEYFSNCPLCRFGFPGGALSPMLFVEHLIVKEGAVPPILVDWLRRLAARIEAAERRR